MYEQEVPARVSFFLKRTVFVIGFYGVGLEYMDNIGNKRKSFVTFLYKNLPLGLFVPKKCEKTLFF